MIGVSDGSAFIATILFLKCAHSKTTCGSWNFVQQDKTSNFTFFQWNEFEPWAGLMAGLGSLRVRAWAAVTLTLFLLHTPASGVNRLEHEGVKSNERSLTNSIFICILLKENFSSLKKMLLNVKSAVTSPSWSWETGWYWLNSCPMNFSPTSNISKLDIVGCWFIIHETIGNNIE